MIDGLMTRCAMFDCCTGFCGKLVKSSYMKSWFFSINIFRENIFCAKSHSKLLRKMQNFQKVSRRYPGLRCWVGWGLQPPPPPQTPRWLWLCFAQAARFAHHFSVLPKFSAHPPPLQISASALACIDYSDKSSRNKCASLAYSGQLLPWPKKNGHLNDAEIRTLFLSWNIEKSSLISQRCGDARSHATGIEVMFTRHHMILRDKNSVLILCIIQVVNFFFFG